jgi:uncharacterized protein (DUF983 family)
MHVWERNESGAGPAQLVMLAIIALVLIVVVLFVLTQLNLIFPPWEAYF